ncbi:MAG TPA: ABC transporter ATP-binding protein [Acidimicrobiia bacterium]
MIEALDVSRDFGSKTVVSGLDLEVPGGTIHALLGPNGAGKTTILRMLAGLTSPTEGTVRVLDGDPALREIRAHIGWIPSGDRSFYLRLSGRENLVFFARLYGMSLRTARERTDELLEKVDLVEAARQPARLYSHGMQKRLVIARGLLTDPPVLIVDEATHDLDPVSAKNVRALITEASSSGAAVVWATQRLEEIRSFAHDVTVLGRGDVRFSGGVDELVKRALSRTYEIQLVNGSTPLPLIASNLVGLAELSEHPFYADRLLLHLGSGTALSDVFQGIERAGAKVHSCAEARSDIEEAFLHLTAEDNDD